MSLFMKITIKISRVDIYEGHIWIRTDIINFCSIYLLINVNTETFAKLLSQESSWNLVDITPFDLIVFEFFFIKTGWVYIWCLYLNQTWSFVYGLIKTYNKFRFHEIIIASCTLITRIHGQANDRQMNKLKSSQNLISIWSA